MVASPAWESRTPYGVTLPEFGVREPDRVSDGDG